MKSIKSYSDVLRRCGYKTPPEGIEGGMCRPWTGRLSGKQPRAIIDGTDVAIRRWVFEQMHGHLPAVVGDICGNALCCNRFHLISSSYSAVKKHSPSAAVRRKAAQTAALSSPRARLDPEKAQAIRADKRSTTEIALEYGISRAHVCRVKAGTRFAPPPCALSAMAAALGGLAA